MTPASQSQENVMTDALYCSFCGKSQHEVRKLIAGPTAFICDECTMLCATIVCSETGVSGTWHISREAPMSVSALAKAVADEMRRTPEQPNTD